MAKASSKKGAGKKAPAKGGKKSPDKAKAKAKSAPAKSDKKPAKGKKSAAPTFARRKANSVEDVTTALNKSQYGRWLSVSSTNSERQIRILDEPENWEFYDRHWPDGGEKHACMGDGCPSCAAGDQPYTDVVFMRVGLVDPDSGKITRIYLYEPPKTVVKDLMKHYKRRGGTLTDRDYVISRTGSGRNDTRYTVINEAPKKRDPEIKKAEKDDVDIDVEFQGMWDRHVIALNRAGDEDEDDPATTSDNAAMDLSDDEDEDEDDIDVEEDEDDDEEEEDDDDADEDEDDEDDDEDDDEEVSAEDVDDMDIDELKALAKDLGIKVPKGSKSPTYKKLIKEALEDDDEDEEDEDEEDVDDADVEVEDDDDDDDDEDDEDDDEDEDEDDSSDSLSGVFTVKDFDADEGTLDLVDGDGQLHSSVFYDEDEIDVKFKKGLHVKITAERDDEGDLVIEEFAVSKSKPKSSAPAKGKAKGKGKKK
jgi:hypothetical protein